MTDKKIELTRLELHVLMSMQGQLASASDIRKLFLGKYPQSLIARRLRLPPKTVGAIETVLRRLKKKELVEFEPTRWYAGEPYPEDILLYKITPAGGNYLSKKK